MKRLLNWDTKGYGVIYDTGTLSYDTGTGMIYLRYLKYLRRYLRYLNLVPYQEGINMRYDTFRYTVYLLQGTGMIKTQ